MRILIIDDEKNVADTLVMILELDGHRAEAVYDGIAALEKSDSFAPDCVISDVLVPGMNGIDVCARIEARHPNCHILLLSGQVETCDLLERARAEGHEWVVLTKPLDPRALLARLSSLELTQREIASQPS
jgi:DNA-binding response OmpR family regulator